MHHDLFVFLLGLWSHWAAIVTGSIVSIIVVIVEKKYQRAVTWKHIGWVMTFALVVSCFLTWRDEHSSAEWRGNEISRLNGVIQEKDSALKAHPQQVIVMAPSTPSKGVGDKLEIYYHDRKLDGQVATLVKPKDLTMPPTGMFVWPNLPNTFTITGIVPRNDGSTTIQADAAYIEFSARVKIWQENASCWRQSPESSADGWTKFECSYGVNSIRSGHPWYVPDFVGTPIPKEVVKVRLTILYGRKKATAKFTIRATQSN